MKHDGQQSSIDLKTHFKQSHLQTHLCLGLLQCVHSKGKNILIHHFHLDAGVQIEPDTFNQWEHIE